MGDDFPTLSRRRNNASSRTRTVGLAGVSAWPDAACRAVGIRLQDRGRCMERWRRCGHAAGERSPQMTIDYVPAVVTAPAPANVILQSGSSERPRGRHSIKPPPHAWEVARFRSVPAAR
jgi:hypothetical protein